MIRYSLVCERKHDFEIWFKNSADYDRQVKRGLVTCPQCNSAKVEKALMTPQLGSSSKKGRRARPADMPPTPETAPTPAQPEATAPSPVAMISPQEHEVRAKLKELREHLTKNADNVGAKFPDEARKMHYGDIEHRSIYGEATAEDAKELHDEGIDFYPLPVLPDDRN